MLVIKSEDIQFSDQALLMLEHMPEITKEEVQEWYIKNQFVIGNQALMEYLLHKKHKV